ncbi:dephospho-CoA kinase [Rheinheimera maricola]|uniref:Dephospho-CoA kinase n=1 Tax=Rheinheimera maricola TaxID=2793282 RepID=A0ABS7X722_9GAMM|nr:dephospho-CoA kinase [Rheinheimera maricola]MBZ9611351.1 dephospho-CoA kinase [Rheinheimera maricola]
MSRFVVGVTGGIGCGKSTISALFAKLGVQYVDADVVAREVVMPGTACLHAISQRFGNSILTASGELDRAVMRQRVFTNAADKAWLEQLLHPAIRQQLLAQLAALTSAYALLVAPLLLENRLQDHVQRVLVIDLPESLQLQRAMARDNSSEQHIKAIMAAQISRTERLKQADDIITNDSNIADLAPQVAALHQQYLQLAAI